jgi:hypothetical protein
MLADSGVYNADHLVWPILNVTIDTGAATRIFYFKPLRRYQIIELQYSADAVDTTDKFTPVLYNVTTSDTILTGAVCDTADTVFSDSTVDSNKSAILLPGHTYRVTLTMAGTAANVKGVTCQLYVKTASH